MPLRITVVSASPGPNSSVISSLIDAEQVISESDSRTSHDSTACTCRLIDPDDPAGMPAGLGGVDRGNHWHVVKFGQRDRRMSDQPVMGVHHVGPPRAVAAPVFQRQPGADHGVAHRQRPGHHVACRR